MRKGWERVGKEREGGSRRTMKRSGAREQSRRREKGWPPGIVAPSYVHSTDRPQLRESSGAKKKARVPEINEISIRGGYKMDQARLIRQIHGHIICTDERNPIQLHDIILTLPILNMSVFPAPISIIRLIYFSSVAQENAFYDVLCFESDSAAVPVRRCMCITLNNSGSDKSIFL